MQGYQPPPSGEHGLPNAALDPVMMSPEPRKRSSLGRDIAIGIGIAVVVLVAVIVIKLVVIDKGSRQRAARPRASTMATIRVTLPSGITADLVVNGARIATVSGTQDVPLSSGTARKVRLVAKDGSACEKQIDLLAGKTNRRSIARSSAAAARAGQRAARAVRRVARVAPGNRAGRRERERLGDDANRR